MTPAQVAKAALRRLALSKLEPTPENYAQAWAEESGELRGAGGLPARARPLAERMAQRLLDDPGQRGEFVAQLLQGQWDEAHRLVERGGESASAQSQAWAQLIERLARGLERGGKQWTAARKKESLQRVLDSSRSDMTRLQTRLRQLVGTWDADQPAPVGVDEAATEGAGAAEVATEAVEPTPVPTPSFAEPGTEAGSAPPAPAKASATASATASAIAAADAPSNPPLRRATDPAWPRVVAPLQATVQAALPPDSDRAVELADELNALGMRLGEEGATPELVALTETVCQRARRLLAHRHHLLDQVHKFSLELTEGLTELAEDESWVQGQVASLRERLAGPPSARAVHSASLLLAHARERQRALRGDRDKARDALKDLIQRMLAELGELGEHTGRFSEGLERYAETIQQADSLESLAGVVREMVDDSRSVQVLVSSTRERLTLEHERATQLEQQVRTLEAELRRLSDEVSTDALTQVANRRGLMQSFETEKARLERDGGPLAVGLLDIDNFKRLNDELGHSAGDQALVALAQRVRDSLRPVDVVARFGGEEFVVLLPGTPVDEAQKVLTRLQRLLSASLFMHEGKEVFVTFSAGVTAYRLGERVEEALERADEALYEAKRAGKNRTCIG